MPHKKPTKKFAGGYIPYQNVVFKGSALVDDSAAPPSPFVSEATIEEMNAAAKAVMQDLKMLGSPKQGSYYTTATEEEIKAAQAKLAQAPPFGSTPSHAPLYCPCCSSPLMFSGPMGALRCSCGTVYISESEMQHLSTQPGAMLLEALRLRMHDAVEKAMHGTMKALVAAWGKAPPANVGILLGEADPFAVIPPAELIPWNAPPKKQHGPGKAKSIADFVQQFQQPQMPPEEPKKKTVPKEALKGFDKLSPALQEFFGDFIEQPAK